MNTSTNTYKSSCKNIMEVMTLGSLFALSYYMSYRMFAHKFEDRPTISKSELQTGDLILFSHNMSRMTHNIVNIEYSHIAMVHRCPNTDELSIMELTTSGDNYLSDNSPALYDLNWRFDKYNGYISIRKLKDEYKPMFTERRMKEVFDELKDIEFDYSFTANFIKKNFLGISRDFDNSYCCSEFIYLFLSRLGVIEYDEDDIQDSFRLLSTDFDDVWTEAYDLES